MKIETRIQKLENELTESQVNLLKAKAEIKYQQWRAEVMQRQILGLERKNELISDEKNRLAQNLEAVLSRINKPLIDQCKETRKWRGYFWSLIVGQAFCVMSYYWLM